MIFIQLFRVYLILIIIRALMSWFNPDPKAPLVRVLIWLTEPALSPIRRIIPPFSIPKTNVRIDLAPFFVLLIGGWLLTKLKF
jgi:YggT family protein